jgi:hypothetical protein
MDRDELVAFIRKMRGRDFTNQEIKLVREYMDEWGIGLAKEKAAPAMAHAKKLGAKDKEEFEFITEYLDDIETTSPEKFRERYGNVKNVNMDINTSIENKLEKHFKKKYKWDDTKKDGGLDDATFTKYEDELYEAQTEFMDFHRVYDTDIQPGSFGFRKSTGWANHPKNYLDEASEKLKSITGEGLNTNFWKNYTDEVLTKYPKPEKFQYGGIAGMLGEPTYQDDNHRVPLKSGKRPISAGLQLLDPDFDDDINMEELIKELIRSTQEKWRGKYQTGGRVPMVFGGSTIGVLKNLLTKMKKSHKIPRGEKSLKPDVFAKSIMTEGDKLKLLQLETKYANSVLEQLKLDRQLFKQLETNKEMKDQGLDFLMKHFVDTQAPHMKNYKSLADIDQAILELETLVKNKTLKEGRQLNASGGRVSLSSGGVAGMLGE